MMNPTNLNLNYLIPTVVSDGNVVMINDNDVPTLVFFEGRQQNGSELNADVVASVRLFGLSDLEALRNSIDETIEKHKSREK